MLITRSFVFAAVSYPIREYAKVEQILLLKSAAVNLLIHIFWCTPLTFKRKSFTQHVLADCSVPEVVRGPQLRRKQIRPPHESLVHLERWTINNQNITRDGKRRIRPASPR